MLEQYISQQSIQCGVQAEDWRQAIRLAAAPLVEQGRVGMSYVQRMIQKVEELGPYIVLDKGVAVAHARPREDVRENSVSFASLQTPVPFGHSTNDPVSLVFVLAATDDNGHVGVMMEVAQLLCGEGIKEKLASASGVQEVYRLIAEG